MSYVRRPFNPLLPTSNQVVNELNQANENFDILANAFQGGDPATGVVLNAVNSQYSQDADKVDGFHASLTPAPYVIPVADSAGKLSVDWFSLMFSSVHVIYPSPYTIYREEKPCLIMVVSRNLYGLQISPNGTIWYGTFGQENNYGFTEGGTITFYVPKDWYWRFSGILNSTNGRFSSQHWLKFVFNF